MNKTTDKNRTAFPQTVEIPQPLEVHPSVSPLAADLLMKTAETLAYNPEFYDQNCAAVSICNSPCCIIGWMCFHAGKKSINIPDEEIGLTKDQEQRIFWPDRWPKGMSQNSDWKYIPAKIGIARIEHFLRTGE